MSADSNDRSTDYSAPSYDRILALTFNQNFTGLAMGTVKTFALFTINQKPKTDGTPDYDVVRLMNPPSLRCEAVYIIERLFSSALLVIVSKQAPRLLEVWHLRRGRLICSYRFRTTICAVKLNRSILVVFLEKSITIFEVQGMRALHSFRNISSNIHGLGALSSHPDHPYLAYPDNFIVNAAQIFDTHSLKDSISIIVDDSPVTAMTFDVYGIRIATASTGDTAVQVAQATDGAVLFEFHCELQKAETINSLAFSPDSMFLAASSNQGIIHIFRLTDPITSSSGDVPNDSGRGSFATIRLSSTGKKTTIAMRNFDEKLILFVADYDGVVSGYEVNTTDGGECRLLSQYNLFRVPISSTNEQSTSANAGENATDGPATASSSNSLENNTNTDPIPSEYSDQNTS